MPILLSTNLIFGRSIAGHVAPFLTAFLRWLGTVVILFPVLWRYRAESLEFVRGNIVLWLFAGTLGMMICGGVVYSSLEHTSATNATLIYATSPLFVLAMDSIINGRRILARELFGMCLATVGITAIAFRGDLSAVYSLAFNLGDIGILLAAISWAGYTLILRSSKLGSLPSSAALGVMGLSGAIVLLPFAGWEVIMGEPGPTRLADWGTLAGMVSVSSVLAYIAMQHAVRHVGASATSLTMYVTPISSAFMATLFLGERIHVYHLTGMVLVIIGLAFATVPVTFGRLRRAAVPKSPSKSQAPLHNTTANVGGDDDAS